MMQCLLSMMPLKLDLRFLNFGKIRYVVMKKGLHTGKCSFIVLMLGFVQFHISAGSCNQPFAILGRLDGDASLGFRLYKDAEKFDTKRKVQGKGNLQATNIQWETIATSLEDFRKVVVRNSKYFILVGQP